MNSEDTYYFPLHKKIKKSYDSSTSMLLNLHIETEIPLGSHVGAFGVTRKNHVHEGVDLYCMPGDEVYSMEEGYVTLIENFTGPLADSPWWENTRAVHIEGQSGVIVYGEILEDPSIFTGKKIKRGDKLGIVKTVLKKDKGRPMTMLHLENYMAGSRESVTWNVGAEQPISLKDPTPLLLKSSL